MNINKLNKEMDDKIHFSVTRKMTEINEKNIALLNAKFDALAKYLGVDFEKQEGYRVIEKGIIMAVKKKKVENILDVSIKILIEQTIDRFNRLIKEAGDIGVDVRLEETFICTTGSNMPQQHYYSILYDYKPIEKNKT